MGSMFSQRPLGQMGLGTAVSWILQHHPYYTRQCVGLGLFRLSGAGGGAVTGSGHTWGDPKSWDVHSCPPASSPVLTLGFTANMREGSSEVGRAVPRPAAERRS